MSSFKKSLIFCSIALAIFIGANNVHAVLISPKTSLTNGLKGWWTFDGVDFVGGKANDVSGNGNMASVRNIATSTFYTAGKIGQAINCDGINDNLAFTSDPIGTGPVTISVWIKPRTWGSALSEAIVWGNTTRLRLNSSGVKRVDFTSNSFTNTATSGSDLLNLVSNRWTHILVTRDASNLATIYIDGSQNGLSNQNSGTPTGSTAGGICESVSSALRFDGLVDDLRIYNRVLSLSEIKELYNQGNSKVNTTPKESLKMGLVSWWTFDGIDFKNGRANDSSGNGNFASPRNIATSTFYTTGKIGQAINCDGIDDNIPLNSDPIGTSATTISAWIKPRSFGSGGSGNIIWGNSTRFRISRLSGPRVEFSSDTLVTTAFSDPIIVGGWLHVVATRNSSNQVTFYINGSQSGTANQASGTPSGSTAGTICDVANSVRFDGIIDDLRVYNRVLSLNEIRGLYNQGATKFEVSPKDSLKKGLVGWWTFDGKNTRWTSSVAGTTVDSSGNGFTGTFKNAFMATTTRAGVLGQSLSLSTLGTYVEVADNDALTFSTADTTDKPFTFTAWVKRDGAQTSPGGGGAIIGKSAGASNTEYLFWISSTDKLEVRTYDNSGTNQISASSVDNITDDNNKWMFYAATYTGSGSNAGFSLYRNGLQMAVTTASAGSYVAMENMTGVFTIGNFFFTSPTFKAPFKGQIDDVRVYNRVLSANELKQLYNQGR